MTPISLAKGGNISLSKEDPNLTKVIVGLGWDVRETDGADYDLDVSVFMLGENRKVQSGSDFIFYNNLSNANGSVVHQGDNRTGAGDGDDEQVKILLPSIPAWVKSLAFAVTIHEGNLTGQNFGGVQNAFIRIVNEETDREISRYDLTEDAGTETAMIFAEVYRNGADWKFKAVGQGFAGGLKPLAQSFGLQIA
jgi:tellurium resistance protein TerD